MASWFAPVLRILGALVEWLKDRHATAAAAAIVQEKTANAEQADQDEIAALIKTAHYDADPKKRAEAFAEIQRRQAIV